MRVAGSGFRLRAPNKNGRAADFNPRGAAQTETCDFAGAVLPGALKMPGSEGGRCRRRKPRLVEMALALAAVTLALTGCSGRPSAAASEPQPRKPPEPARLHICLATAVAQPDLEEITDPDGLRLYLAPAAEFTNIDLADARALHSPQRSMLQIVLNRPAAIRLERLTRAHYGHWLAAYIDDQLIATDRITRVIRDGRLNLVGPFSRAQAETWAERLMRGRP